MALDVPAVPAMSDECERLFSSAKLLLTDRRPRLRMDIIEACECLRAWYGSRLRSPQLSMRRQLMSQTMDQEVHVPKNIDGAHHSSDWEDGHSYGDM